MILVTGAAGKTGEAVIRALAKGDEPVRVFVRRESQVSPLIAIGAMQGFVGDFLNPEELNRAFQGIRTVYHICPNMSPEESLIGTHVISAAKQNGLEHFVYHSVLHPQVKVMTHHWNKLQVEALLFESGLGYTILQPASYMQNVLGYWQKMVDDGIYAVPYSVDAQFSMVDLDDLGQAAARVIREGKAHYQAIYECCGVQILTNNEIAECVSAVIGRQVKAVALDRGEWANSMRAKGAAENTISTLLGMFEYYDQYGFAGNGNVLTWLLGRTPARFEEFLNRSKPSNR